MKSNSGPWERSLKKWTEWVDSLDEDQFLELYGDMTRRMKAMTPSPDSELNPGDPIVLMPKNEDEIPATVSSLLSFGFKAVTVDGIVAHVSPGCKYRKLDFPSEGDKVLIIEPRKGRTEATLVKDMGSVCKVEDEEQNTPRFVPRAWLRAST